jgi:hypothetical protein
MNPFDLDSISTIGNNNDNFPVAFYEISAAVGLAFVTAGTIQLVVQNRSKLNRF